MEDAIYVTAYDLEGNEEELLVDVADLGNLLILSKVCNVTAKDDQVILSLEATDDDEHFLGFDISL